MKQLLRIKKDIVVKDVPAPVCAANELLIKNLYSLIIPSVEKDIVASNKGGMLKKLMSQKDLLDFALRKVRTDGISKAYAFGKAMMSNWHTLGAVSMGKVIEVGREVKDIKKGEGVVCAGWYLANHAQYVAVPRSLAAAVPEGSDPFVSLLSPYGAKMIMMLDQLGIPDGATLLVYGQTIGASLLVELLRENGKGKNWKVHTFEQVLNGAFKGAVDYIFSMHAELSAGDVAILHDACSSKAAYVAITEKEMPKDFLKQLSVPCTQYAYFFSDRMLHLGAQEAQKQLLINTLSQDAIDAFFQFAKRKKEFFEHISRKETTLLNASEAYEKNAASDDLSIIKYDTGALQEMQSQNTSQTPSQAPSQTVKYFEKEKPKGAYGIAVLGGGNMARAVHLPLLFGRPDAFIKYIFTKSGRSAASVASHYQIPYATSSYKDILSDPEIDVVVILTHHSTHAAYAIEAMREGKHVFVEKPLCLTREECSQLQKAYREACKKSPQHQLVFSVGFNKTFSPLAQEAKSMFSQRKHPLLISYRLQAPINLNKPWYYDPSIGGGRLVGEYCHLFDFAQWITGSPISSVEVAPLRTADPYILPESNLAVLLSFEDGSAATLLCSEDGNADSSKERIEMIADNTVVVIDDWKEIMINGKKKATPVQKGYAEHWDAFFRKIRMIESKEKENSDGGHDIGLVDVERAVAVMNACFGANEKVNKVMAA